MSVMAQSQRATVDCNMTSLIIILCTCPKDIRKGISFAQWVSKTTVMLDG